VKAVVQSRYGPPDEVLSLGEIDEPRAGRDLVLVGVRATSIHADVWHAVTGLPYVMRLMGSGLRGPIQPVPGTDVAGVVEAIGPGVTGFRPGDEVFGEVVAWNQWRNGGTFAERVAVPEARLVPKPPDLSFVDAAAVPTSASIALRSVRGEGRVEAGQRVLVNGAGGGVGSFAVQIAAGAGAHVTGVDLGTKTEMLTSLGAERVIDAAHDDFTRSGERYDLIVDVPGNRSWADLSRALAPDGTYVLVGHDGYGATSGRWLGSMRRFGGLLARSPFDRRIPGVRSFRDAIPDPMAEIVGLLETGAIRPAVDRTFPLDDVLAAMRFLMSGAARGKVVLTV
jgi:NADPH:quinone reductase-like Zn-dependent oxidoreductase